MKRKSLLFLLLMAIFAPWAAMAQTLTIYDGEPQTTNRYVPIDGYNVDGTSIKSECVIPASQLTAMNGKEITQMTYYLSTVGNRSWGNATFKVFLKEVEFTTISSLQGLTGATVVYDTKGLDCTQSTMDVVFDNPYTYNGGNLLVGVYIVAKGTYTGSYNDYKPLYAGQTVTGASYHSSAGQQNFIPKTTFTYEVPPCCPKPKDLACTATTGTPATATFTWTNGGEETQWQLEYGTASDFSGASTVTINQSDLVNGAYTLTGLTAEQTYYARIKAYCPSCEPNYSDWSNTVNFKPTNAVTACEDFEGVTGTSYSTEGNMPEGWYSYTTATGNSIVAPHVCSGSSYNYYHSASQSLVFESGTNANGNAAYAVMPANTVDGDYVSLTFYTRVENTSYGTLQIGYVTAQNAAACNNFTPLTSATITYSTTVHQETIDVSSVPSDAFIAFKWQSTTGTYYACGVDDVCLSILPNPTPRPRNLQVSNITSSGATVSWQAPASATPTSYQYRYYNGINWTGWESTADLSVDLTLTASTPYTVQVKAIYDGGGESDPIETDFTTLDDCAFPTNLMPYTVQGEGTTATLSWRPGYDETAWVLQYATNADFTEGLVEITSGFVTQVVEEVTYILRPLTGLTPEQTYYARVMANCDGPTSSWSDVVSFTPTNYVDFQYMENPTTTASVIPFSGSYTTSTTDQSQFIIPKSEILDMAGGTIRRITYYSSTANTNWGGVTFDVYMAEVQNETFSSATFIDWTTLTNVYTGTVSLQDGMMAIEFGNNYTYNGGNLLIGFKLNTAGTAIQSVSWRVSSGSGNRAVYQYGTNNASTSTYRPKITFNYQPSPYKKPVIDEDHSTFGTTSANIAWTVPFSANPTGYQYQYKLASTTEWPTTWTSVTAATAYADLSDLTPGSFYDFRVKALYEGNHESAVVNYEFWTQCAVVTAFPWKEDFEGYNTGNFSHPCWVNQHLSGDGSNLYSVVTESMGDNNTKKLKLNDQSAGTETMLRLPEMNLPGNDYQFVIDVYRNTSTYQEYPYELEGIHVYVSTNGNLEGATELAYIPRHKDVSNSLIPAEEETGWYTYEIPVGISGNCYIILKGVNQWCTSIYMDNFGVEQIPTCARPKDLAYSNVTNHSAKLNWTAGDTEQTLWQVAYSKTNFDPNTANFDVTTVNTVDATANPYTFAGTLDAESTYYMYVRANCGTATEPDYGPWSRKGISFTTLAATPAPSNFVATNPASAKVDLVWNAGGGDTETWELYYVASSTDPEAPTATTTATKTVDELPTTEHPYVLDGLDPVTKYYAWIRAKHVYNNEVTYSDWVALTGDYFETLDACPTPTGLAYTNLTSVSADLSWVGSTDVESYTVQYRTAAGMDANILSEEFANTTIPTDWEKQKGQFNETEGTASLTSDSYGWYFGTDHSVFNSNHAYVNIYGNNQKWLITKKITLGEGNKLSFDLALTAYSSSSTTPATTGTDDKFMVLVSTDDKATWTALRKWDNAGSPYVYNNIAVAGENITLDLSSFNNESVYIAFYGESTTTNADNNLHIDNVMVGTPIAAGAWTDATTNETNQSYSLTGLTAGTKYDVHVKSNCTSGEYCEPISFTTLAEGNMVFTNATNDGKWGNSGNWAPAQLPVLTDEVILRANATIESGCVAEAKKINLNSNTLTIADGGQLKTDNSVTATVKKNITGYGESDGGYCLISTPLDVTYGSASTYGMITDNLGSSATPATSTYDLYKWSTSSSATYDEWRNYRASTFSIANGTGYLYASKNGVELTFTGAVKANNTDISKTPSYTTSGTFEFNGWNLYANPFVCDAYINDVNENESETPMAFYRMNEQGDGYVAATGAIHPMEGIFVQATKTGQSFKFSREYKVNNSRGQLNINLSKAGTRGVSLADNAIVRFGEGSTLEKFSFRENSSKVYIPMEGKDYAVVSAEQTGEIPVSFKAEKNGTYSLNFTSQEVSFSYLHLIDNLTGNDVDLLANPSYSFDAQVTDYAQRFKLVFATGSSAEGDSFGFVNGMGNLCIFGIEGEATIQVIDMLGHMISSDTFSGSYERKLNVAPGVYMIRLINGNDVKVQKIVVR